MKSIYKLVPIFLLFLMGCEKIINIPLDQGDLKIVVSGVINPDSCVVVAVTSSKQLIMPDPFAMPQDSMVINHIGLYENDQFVGNLEYLHSVFYRLPGFKPATGKTYRIEVSATERNTVEGKTTIPDIIPINSLDATLTKVNKDTSRLDVEFEFSDPVDQVNYYALEVTGIQNFWDSRNQLFTDSLVTRYYRVSVNGKTDDLFDLVFLDVNQDIRIDRKILFGDQLFNGQDFKIQFSLLKTPTNRRPDSVNFRVKLQQLDPSYYHYAVSEQKYRKTVDNPFAEPVQVYSNVSNGYGLFTSYSESVKEFMVYWEK